MLPVPVRDTVFVSYSHADRDHVVRVVRELRRYGQASFPEATIWTDEQIMAGESWRRTIIDQIDRAAACLLFVSDPFLASRFIMDEELPRLIDAGIPRLGVSSGTPPGIRFRTSLNGSCCTYRARTASCAITWSRRAGMAP